MPDEFKRVETKALKMAEWFHEKGSKYLTYVSPVTVRFFGGSRDLNGKLFPAVSYTHWYGNNCIQIHLPTYDKPMYQRANRYAYFRTEDSWVDDPALTARAASLYAYTASGMYNEVKPEYAPYHPFGQRSLRLYEWHDMQFGDKDWNMIHTVVGGKYHGEPRKYKVASFTVYPI